MDAWLLGDWAKNERAVKLQPSWKTIRVIQDKYLQKAHLIEAGVSTTETLPVISSTRECLAEIGSMLGYPFMLKSRTLAYDGRGNYVIKNTDAITGALETLKGRPLYAEKWAAFTKELAVMVVRTKAGECISYPTVETVHEDNICKLVYAPARVGAGTMEKARKLAEKAVGSFWGAGVFGVEMFLLEDGEFTSVTCAVLFLVVPFLNEARLPAHQRARSSSPQLWTLHHRSLRDLTVRSSHPRHHRTLLGIALRLPFHPQHERDNAEPPRPQHLRHCTCRPGHQRRHDPPLRQVRSQSRPQDGPRHRPRWQHERG